MNSPRNTLAYWFRLDTGLRGNTPLRSPTGRRTGMPVIPNICAANSHQPDQAKGILSLCPPKKLTKFEKFTHHGREEGECACRFEKVWNTQETRFVANIQVCHSKVGSVSVYVRCEALARMHWHPRPHPRPVQAHKHQLKARS